MAVFETIRTFPFAPADLAPVAEDVAEHFRRQAFEVESQGTVTGGYDVSVTKGGTFKAVLGLKTALKIEITPMDGNVRARAGVGLFGLQAIPTAITLFIFWPVVLAQIGGMVQQAKLDDEAIQAVEDSLKARSSGTAVHAGTGAQAGGFCPECGAALPAGAKFCPSCGKQAA